MSQKLVDREKASLRKHGVESASGMSLAQDKAITVRMPGCFGVHAQDAAVKHGQDIGAGKDRANVGSAAPVSHPQCVNTNAPCQGNGIDGCLLTHLWYP